MEKIKLGKKCIYYNYVKNNFVYVAEKNCSQKECFRPHYFMDKQIYACVNNYNRGCLDKIKKNND